MKKRSFLICLLPILLCSCKEDKGKLDPTQPFQICRNGDLLANTYEDPSYQDLGNGVDSTYLEKILESGEGVTFIKTSDTCSSCKAFHDSFVSFVEDYQLDIAVFLSNNADTYAFSDKIQSIFQKNEIEQDESHPFFRNTPTWYYASKEGKVRIANWGAETRKALERNFFSQASLTNVYKFSSLDNLQKALESKPSTLVYRLDYQNESSFGFYGESLFPLAKTSTRPTYVLDMSRLSKEEKEKANAYFGDYDLLYKDQKKSVKDNSSTALIKEYY